MIALLLLLSCHSAPTAPQLPDPALELLTGLDADGDHVLSAAEIPGRGGWRTLPMLDTDGDGVISLQELRADLDTTRTRH